MYQRSGSSVKGMHRGSQQKRISRQQLQSSSSRTPATAAAAAAARGDAAQRSLYRVHECGQGSIDRELQLGAMIFGCMAVALAMNGRLDEHDVACHRAGGVKIWKCLNGKIETGNFDDRTQYLRTNHDSQQS